jgi:hypothetical protein
MHLQAQPNEHLEVPGGYIGTERLRALGGAVASALGERVPGPPRCRACAVHTHAHSR